VSRKSAHQRGYDARWQKARAAFLAFPENALCRLCQAHGRIVAATVVDHITPHRGDLRLFWNPTNWQPLCKRCHNAKSAQEQASYRTGSKPVVAKGCGLDGAPVDPAHHWNR
jgi:5-methylcytosine-specific restriction protein A